MNDEHACQLKRALLYFMDNGYKCDDETKKHMVPLLECAEQFLAAGKDWPIPYAPDNDQGILSDDEIGYNKAIDECRAVIAKEYVKKANLPTEDELRNLIMSFWSSYHDSSYCTNMAKLIIDKIYEGNR